MRPRISFWIKFLPVAVFFILLSLSVRMGDLWYDLKETPVTFERQVGLAANEKMIPVNTQTQNPQGITPNELLVLQQLSSRREELDKRENELAQKQVALEKQEQLLNEKQKMLADMERKIQMQGGDVLAEDTQLVRIYTQMKPKEAARILEPMDNAFVLKILRKMPPLQASAILERMPSEKAQHLTLDLVNPPSP